MHSRMGRHRNVIPLFPSHTDGASTRLPIAGRTFECWAQENAGRIWKVLLLSDRRDVTFNDLARELWEQI